MKMSEGAAIIKSSFATLNFYKWRKRFIHRTRNCRDGAAERLVYLGRIAISSTGVATGG
jgi:hypothetical protein